MFCNSLTKRCDTGEQIDSDGESGESCESALTTNTVEAVENLNKKFIYGNHRNMDILAEAALEMYMEDQAQLDDASDVESATTFP